MKHLILIFTSFLMLAPAAFADRTATTYAIDLDLLETEDASPAVGAPQKIDPSSLISTGGKAKAAEKSGVGKPEKVESKSKKFELPKSFRNGCGSWPICSPFYKALKACEPTCEPINYTSYNNRGDGGRSCHNSGRAIDVFGIKCSDTGKSYMAIGNSQRFRDLIKCSRQKGLVVLYRNKNPHKCGITQAHYDHAHFSIKCHGGKYW
jgi:hypothetical protein